MQSGDVILTIPHGFTVTFKGYVAGQVSTYKISKGENQWELFTGTTEELLRHCADKVKAINEHVDKFGGIRV
jgi:hypothetical protein